MARYGLPYQGSKSRIAEWVVEHLPPSHTLVDLFAGGGAITHCALLSGKWEHIVMNDVTDTPRVFLDVVRGEYQGFATVPTRDEFMASEDTMLRMLYSFGNDKTTYLWADELAAVKVPASKMLCAPSLHERRMAYMQFCKELAKWIMERGASELDPDGKTGHGLQGIQSLERIQSLAKTLYPHGVSEVENFERLQALERVEALERDYRAVPIPDGATVYCDPPYRGTPNSSRYGAFDFQAFDMWLGGVDFPVIVSEYDAPEGCVEFASIERTTTMSATTTDKRVERLFVQERFLSDVKPLTLF